MKRLLLFGALVFAQITLTLFAAYAALGAATPKDAVVNGVFFDSADYSGLNAAAAAETIKNVCEAKIENGVAAVMCRDAEFLFRFGEIGLYADYSGIETKIAVKNPETYFYGLLSAFTRRGNMDAGPAFYADAGAFRRKLALVKEYVDAPAVNADIDITGDGGLIKTPSAKGAHFDLDGYFDAIYKSFLSAPFEPLPIDPENGAALSAVAFTEPRVADDLLADVDAILAEIIVPLPDACDYSLAARAAESINKVWAPKKGASNAPFSYLRYIEDAGLAADSGSPECAFVASALFHALLASGLDYSKMELGFAEGSGAYPPLPGFGAALQAGADGGAARDFRFTNTLGGNIVIFSSADNGELRVAIAGNAKDAGRGAAPYEILSEAGAGKFTLYKGGKKIAERRLG